MLTLVLIAGLGLHLAGCESVRMVREDQSFEADSQSATIENSHGAQGDWGSLGNPNGSGGGTASEDK